MRTTLFLTLILAVGCADTSPRESGPPPATQYLSDYFVFVSDAGVEPLIVPLDVNWEWRSDEALFVEFKAWRGTTSDWPMLYHVGEELLDGAFPTERGDLPQIGGFSFGASGVTAASSEIGRLHLELPTYTTAAVHDDGDSPVAFSVGLTTLTDGSTRRDGWLIHETVRLKRQVKAPGSTSMFTRFFWFVLVVDDRFLVRDPAR